jgi:integrase
MNPRKETPSKVRYLQDFTTRKKEGASAAPDSLQWWMDKYLDLVIRGVRPDNVTKKIELHLTRFREHFVEAYGHDRASACLRRDVVAWQQELFKQELAPATVNNHLASLSGCTTWIHAQAPMLFVNGDPAKGVGELGLPPLEPRTLTVDQVRSLKNLCDRLHRFHQLKGAPGETTTRLHAHARPWRDRAIVFFLLSTGLRREELVLLDLDQVVPNTPEALRSARKAQVLRVKGKGKTMRHVFLSADARVALADYLEQERPRDTTSAEATALFLSATGLPARREDGRLSTRSINTILEQIGKWHDAEQKDEARKISPLQPHSLRHTYAFQLSLKTKADRYELERRLGHRSERYIARYTNPPENVAAQYVEDF